MSKDDASRSRNKHMYCPYHVVRDLFIVGKVAIVYCSTTDMIADVFFKPLTMILFQKYQNVLGFLYDNHAAPSEQRGCVGKTTVMSCQNCLSAGEKILVFLMGCLR